MKHVPPKVCAFGVPLLLWVVPEGAEAIPTFARQTGFDCPVCHTIFPELTPVGRRFKLGGFTWTSKEPEVKLVEGKQDETGAEEKIRLWLSQLPGLSAFVQADVTVWNRNPVDTDAQGNPHFAQEPEVLLPKLISLMYAGRVSDKTGVWAQLTYDQLSGTVGIDNFDLRPWVDHSPGGDLGNPFGHWGDWLWGITLNNQPTTTDVYATGGSSIGGNTGFGIPNFPPETNIASPVTPLIFNLAQISAGLGVYGFFKDSLYWEVAGYFSAKPAQLRLDTSNIAPLGTIDNVAPYWRVAWETDWDNLQQSFMIGTMGMYTQYAQPAATSFNAPGTYLDFGFDAQYQYIGDNHILTLGAHWMHELSTNSAALVGSAYSNPNDYLDRISLVARYLYRRTYGILVNFVTIHGSSDPLAYCGSLQVCNGIPTSQWETFELYYMLRLNIKLMLQYNLFNGLGSSANAFAGIPNTHVSDNNSLVAALWFAF
jgi:hypothetical protein